MVIWIRFGYMYPIPVSKDISKILSNGFLVLNINKKELE